LIPTREEVFDFVRVLGGAWVVWRPVPGIGDMVMISPGLTALKSEIGDDPLIVSCLDYIAPIARMNPAVDYVLAYHQDEVDRHQDREDLEMLDGIGSVIYRLYDPCPASKYESEFNPYYMDEFGRTVPTYRDIVRSRQEIFAKAMGVKFSVANYNMKLEEEYEDRWSKLGAGGRYVAVQIRSHDAWRDYPKMGWLLHELVALGKKMDFGVVAIDSTQVVDMKGVESLAGLELMNTVAIIKRALMLVGPDSMGVHVAGAFGVPTLGLFGPTNPRIRLQYTNAHWMPRHKALGRVCPRQYCWYTPCKYQYCMTSLSMNPRRVRKRARIILEEAES